MSNNSLTLTSTLVKKSFDIENISVSLFCTKLFQCTSFFLNASILFLSAEILVQNPGIKLVQMAKYIRQICTPTIHISTKRNSANWEFPSLKNCFVSPLSSRKRRKNSPFWQVSYCCMDGEDVHDANPYFRTVFSFSSSSVGFEFHWQFSRRPFARFQIRFFGAKCSRWIMQWANNISSCATSLIFATVMVDVPSHVEIPRKWCYAVCKGITW